MATRSYDVRSCQKCNRGFAPKGPRQLYCNKPDCEKVAAIAPANGVLKEPATDTSEPEAANGEQLTAHDVVDAFGLNYNLGNVVRFVLEHDDGDELENLTAARTYLERAITRLTPSA
jgi:hypothetical protein